MVLPERRNVSCTEGAERDARIELLAGGGANLAASTTRTTLSNSPEAGARR